MDQQGLKFYEVGRGALAVEMQRAFDQAQDISFRREVDVSINLKITVHAPERENPEYGAVSFAVTVSQPARKSIKFPTMLEGGRIQHDGTSVSQLLQGDMWDDLKNTIENNRKE